MYFSPRDTAAKRVAYQVIEQQNGKYQHVIWQYAGDKRLYYILCALLGKDKFVFRCSII